MSEGVPVEGQKNAQDAPGVVSGNQGPLHEEDEPWGPHSPQRVVFCDTADVRPVSATLRALGLDQTTVVRVWETPNNGAVAYLRCDSLRDLAGGGTDAGQA